MRNVVAYTWPKTQKAHKGYNRPEVAAGTTVFAIRDGYTGLYFHYAYTNLRYAEEVACKIQDADLSANFRQAPAVVSGLD